MGFEEMWRELLPVGRVSGGGYRRFSWTAADRECRAWFAEQADRRRGIIDNLIEPCAHRDPADSPEGKS